MKRDHRARFAWAMLCFAVPALAGTSRCGAQVETPPEPQQETQPADPPPFTLHAYANLVQIATLVLSWKSKPLPPIEREHFAIRLDSGPPFRPTAMHIEGNDAIDLAVLIDASGDQKEMLEHFDDALEAMARAGLLRHDHITVYAVDCALVRAPAVTADDGPGIKSAVAAALAYPMLHGTRGKRCEGEIHLRDSLVWMGNELANSSARRVILAITDGEDSKSTHSWRETKDFLEVHGVAVFGVHDSYDAFVDASKPGEALFRLLCEGTGGLYLDSSVAQIGVTLGRFITLVRGRYILEFPRPSENRPGQHLVEISVPGTHDFIVHTGALIPLPDPSMLAGPDLVPTTKSPATYGSRHPIKPQR
jgi:hypothetical protein